MRVRIGRLVLLLAAAAGVAGCGPDPARHQEPNPPTRNAPAANADGDTATAEKPTPKPRTRKAPAAKADGDTATAEKPAPKPRTRKAPAKKPAEAPAAE